MITKSNTVQQELTWGILGTGYIAKVFAKAIIMSKTGKLVAVGSRSQENARRFADEFKIPHYHSTYEALLADSTVQAIYIATPHSLHGIWTERACEAGKHVLCEKPLAVNHSQAVSMFQAANRAKVFLMEAFMYRFHPQTTKLVDLLRSRIIGDLQVIDARYSFAASYNVEHRLFRKDLAGGGILDVGCYPVSMVRLVAGAGLGHDFMEPVEVKGIAHLGKTGVDEYAAAAMRFPGGIIAELAAGITFERDLTMRIYGTAGTITVPNPYAGPFTPEIILQLNSEKKPKTIPISVKAPSFNLEVDAFAVGVAEGKVPFPAPSKEDSLGNMKALDLWREAVSLVYEVER